MVIAAYAGTGKTAFCYENPAAIDLIAMPFKYTTCPIYQKKKKLMGKR